ncbi:hypothetical protein CsSME_00019157 [Camellia sinensis var. sinensis]
MTNQIIPTTKKSKHSILELLPTQIILEILSRLPIKTLFLCQLVSKHWLSLISDSHIANLHLSRSPVSLCSNPSTPVANRDNFAWSTSKSLIPLTPAMPI